MVVLLFMFSVMVCDWLFLVISLVVVWFVVLVL